MRGHALLNHAHTARAHQAVHLLPDAIFLSEVQTSETSGGAQPPSVLTPQAQAQAAAAVAAHTALTQQRKELQGRLDRLAVEAERAGRAKKTAELQCSALQQQCRLLEAVARGQAALGGGRSQRRGQRSGGSKENATDGEGPFRIKARRPHRLALSTSSSD